MSDLQSPATTDSYIGLTDIQIGERASLGATAIEELRSRLRGALLTPGSPGYEEGRRVWNGMIDRRPALIARCAGTADVIATVQFARDRGVPVSVRCGGHNVAGNAVIDGGVVIDLSRMRGVRVDPERRLARVEGGARLGDVDHETQAFGLAAPFGLMSKTGVAGLTLHGGLGALTRRHGLSSDSLVGADVVTADGRLLVVNEQTHPDLLWALRGGGGNFGVVTSFEFRLYPVGPDVWVALVLYPVAEAARVLDYFRTAMAHAPDEMMAIALFWNAPGEEPIPEEYRGAPVFILAAWHTGSPVEAERDLRPFREIATPIADLSGPMPYIVAQKLFDHDYPDGRRYYWKSLYLSDLGDEVIGVLREHASRRPSPLSTVEVWALGGAFGRVGPGETAFSRRDAPFLFAVESNWDDPGEDDANLAWARELYRSLQRFSPGGSYLNFPGLAEEGEALVRAAYPGNYERLRTIKSAYDPENLFRSNVNIRPGT